MVLEISKIKGGMNGSRGNTVDGQDWQTLVLTHFKIAKESKMGKEAVIHFSMTDIPTPEILLYALPPYQIPLDRICWKFEDYICKGQIQTSTYRYYKDGS